MTTTIATVKATTMTPREREARKEVRQLIKFWEKDDIPLWKLCEIMNYYHELDWKKIRKYYGI